MNLPDYFEPVDFSQFQSNGKVFGKFTLGYSVEKMNKKLFEASSSKTDIAILGVPYENGKYQEKAKRTPDKIRQVLYRLAPIDKNLKVADLGNLKSSTSGKGMFLGLRDVVEYLQETNVVTVILGGSQDLTLGICEAFKNNRFFWLSAVDARLDVKKETEIFHSANYLTRLFKVLPNLFHFSLIGYQNHLVGEALIKKTAGIGEHLRLGQLRDDMSQAELLLRSTNVLSFDMGAVKYIEAPSTSQKNPNGLNGEDACQLAQYAGLSPRLTVFGLFETGVDEKEDCPTPKLAAEIIWYFLEGFSHRKAINTRTVYKVKIEGLDYPLVFLHEMESNRWWFEVQSVSGEVIEVACSENDYRKAANNEIPGRWLKFVQKMDGLLK